jgi:hypothetical protein
MKSYLFLLLAGAALLTRPAHGQGLMAIGQRADYEDSVPLTFIVGAGGGYDRVDYSGTDLGDYDSWFVNGAVGLLYAKNDPTTPWDVGADFGVIQYLDDTNRGEDLYYRARVSFNIKHEFSRRLWVQDNAYFTYDAEPDFGVGASTGRRSGQYVYGYNKLSVGYAWSERVATTTSHTVEGIKYTDSDELGDIEDRLTNIFAQEVSYALSRRTKLVGEYRFRITQYDSSPAGLPSPDYTSHYLLAGVDNAWSERLSSSLRVGAEIYESDRTSETAPYAEGSLTYALSRRTVARFYAQVGFDAAELGDYNSRYSYRTGVTATHHFTEKLSGTAGLHYVHSEYEGGLSGDASEDEIDAALGLSYNFWNNLSLDAGYTFTTISSDTDFGDYDRHRVNVGLNATF